MNPAREERLVGRHGIKEIGGRLQVLSQNYAKEFELRRRWRILNPGPKNKTSKDAYRESLLSKTQPQTSKTQKKPESLAQ